MNSQYAYARSGLGDTGIPFVDDLINRGKSLLQSQVQRVTERVADFKLLPRQHRAIRIRLGVLRATPAVTDNSIWSTNVTGLLASLGATESAYQVTNSQLDAALSQMSAISTSSVNPAMLSMIASLYSGMNTAFAKTKQIDAGTKAIEAVALTPAQQAMAARLGAVSPVGLSMQTMLLVAGGAYLAYKAMHK